MAAKSMTSESLPSSMTSLSTSKSYINPSQVTLFSFSGLWKAKRESVSVIIIITFSCFISLSLSINPVEIEGSKIFFKSLAMDSKLHLPLYFLFIYVTNLHSYSRVNSTPEYAEKCVQI